MVWNSVSYWSTHSQFKYNQLVSRRYLTGKPKCVINLFVSLSFGFTFSLSFCMWNISRVQNNVDLLDPGSRTYMIQRYLLRKCMKINELILKKLNLPLVFGIYKKNNSCSIGQICDKKIWIQDKKYFFWPWFLVHFK